MEGLKSMNDESRPLYDRVYKNPDKSPEKRLFEAILMKFLHDVQSDYDAFRESTNGKVEKLHNELVKHKATALSEHIDMVCGLVGIDSDVFKKAICDVADGKRRVDIASIHW